MKRKQTMLTALLLAMMLLFGSMTAPAAAESDPVLSFSTTRLNGKSIDSSILEKYDLIWVNFWAEWCGPCVSEMPELQKIYKNYSNVLILGVWVGSDLESAIETADDAGVKYPLLNLSYEGTLYDYACRSQYIPASYFFDRNGNKVGEDYIGSRDYDSWKSIVDTLLKDLPQDPEEPVTVAKPKIKTQPSSVTVAAGKKVTFRVKASGKKLTYQWYYRTSSKGSWKKVSGAAGKKAAYTFKATAKKNGYQYRCLVKNPGGKVYSKIAKLKVKTGSKGE